MRIINLKKMKKNGINIEDQNKRNGNLIFQNKMIETILDILSVVRLK